MRCVIRPFDPTLKKQRSILLQKCLRENDSGYPIDAEYPIVLDPKKNNLSLCMIHEESRQLVAHANCWPRRFLDLQSQESFAVALIGNVATHPSFRKQGLMHQLFSYLTNTLQNQGFDALVLWSDLNSFYQNLGFVRFGTELRWTFGRNFLPSELLLPLKISINESTIADDRKQIMALRYPHCSTLERSPEEFEKLLKIPDTHLLIARKGEQITAFGILGKGADMVGVIHEWGAEHPPDFAAIIDAAQQHIHSQNICVLSPNNLEIPWQNFFRNHTEDYEQHAMAWIKHLQQDSRLQDLATHAFIWGLDSI